MTMRRRSFLGMFGAAVAAPALPMAMPVAGVSQASYGLAAAHAQKYPLVSVMGLTKRIGLSPAQAQAVIQKMSAEGVLGAVNPLRPGGAHAVSNVCTNDAWRGVLVNQPKPIAKADFKTGSSVKPAKPRKGFGEVDLIDMFAHLHDMCLSRGMTLSPKCMGMAA